MKFLVAIVHGGKIWIWLLNVVGLVNRLLFIWFQCLLVVQRKKQILMSVFTELSRYLRVKFVCFFLKKRKTSSPFFNAGFKIRTVDRWKPVAFEKKIGEENFNIGKKNRNEGEMKKKMFTYKTVNSDHIKLLFTIKDKHDKWLVK